MTNNNFKLSQLTPAAREVINELAEVYKASLIEKAYQIARKRNTDNEDISLRDVLEAQDDESTKYRTDKLFKQEAYNYKRKRISIVFTLTGCVYTLTGLTIYIFQNRHFSLYHDLGFIIAILGAFIVVCGLLYTQIAVYFPDKLRKDRFSNIDNYDIVKKWQTIELLTVSFLKSKGLLNQKSNPVSQVVNFLSARFAASENEYVSIRKLLTARNKVLHEGVELSDDEKKRYVAAADAIIANLEQLR